jgi:hypothetical protein
MEKMVGRTSHRVLVTRECLLFHLLSSVYLMPRALAPANVRQGVV